MPRSPQEILPRSTRRSGFTLVELLVVIGIILLLVGILVPTISRVRTAGQSADTRALLTALDAAAQTYYQDHQEWPGVFEDAQLGIGAIPTDPMGNPVEVLVSSGDFFGSGTELENVTGGENFALSLLGGIIPAPAGSGAGSEVVYDPAAFGRGPVKLGGRSPGGYRAYFDGGAGDTSMHVANSEYDETYTGETVAGQQWGRFVDAASAAQDSIVPEFVDRYSSPMPVLYVRAQPTGRNAAVMGLPGDNPRPTFYYGAIAGYVEENAGSGAGYIGVGKDPEEDFATEGSAVSVAPPASVYHGLTITRYGGATAPASLRQSMEPDSANYTYPYDARAYLLSPSTDQARQADRYVLISAGPDRIYGTSDDITNFGSVKQ